MRAGVQPEVIEEDDIKSVRSSLSIYCRKRGEICDHYLKIMRELGALLASNRMLRLFDVDRGVDASLARVITGIVKLYSEFLIGIQVTMGGRMLVKILSDAALHGRSFRRGEMVAVELADALLLSQIGVAKPMRSLAVELG